MTKHIKFPYRILIFFTRWYSCVRGLIGGVGDVCVAENYSNMCKSSRLSSKENVWLGFKFYSCHFSTSTIASVGHSTIVVAHQYHHCLIMCDGFLQIKLWTNEWASVPTSRSYDQSSTMNSPSLLPLASRNNINNLSHAMLFFCNIEFWESWLNSLLLIQNQHIFPPHVTLASVRKKIKNKSLKVCTLAG